MYKYLLLFFALNLFVFSQNDVSDEVGQQNEQTVADEPKKDDVIKNDPYSRLKRYAPITQSAKDIQANKELRDFDLINKIIDDTKTKFSSIIASHSDRGAHAYFQNYVKNYQNVYSFDTTTNIYDAARSTAVQTQELFKTIERLERALNKFNDIRVPLKALGKTEEELNNSDIEINSLLGLFYTLEGSLNNLKKAKEKYEYVMFGSSDNIEKDTPIIADLEKKKEELSTLIGVNDKIISKENNDVWRFQYIQDQLFYMWKLTDILTEDNQDLKEYRFNKLLKKYLNVVDLQGRRYQKYYKKYYDGMIKTNLGIINAKEADTKKVGNNVNATNNNEETVPNNVAVEE